MPDLHVKKHAYKQHRAVRTAFPDIDEAGFDETARTDELRIGERS